MILDRNEIILNRYRKVSELRSKGINPYPHRYEPTHHSIDILNNPDTFIEQQHKVRVAGRILNIRSFGKAAFFLLRDGYGTIQIMVRKGSTDDTDLELFKDYIDNGDIVGIEGPVFRTKTQEVTVLAERLFLLTKSVRALPEKWHGLKDREQRYRQRYVDLIVNESVRENFRKRTAILNSIRAYLNQHDYLEVETPMMQPIYGGALARPFTTYHNALDMQLFLRIAPELYLKRLIVGGFEKVYEINRNFRNEGLSTVHNPEFTMLELYTAYWDYRNTMVLVENLFKHVCREILGSLSFPFGEQTIDFNSEWRRLTILDAIHEYTGLELDWHDSADKVMHIVLDNLEVSREEIKRLSTDELIMMIYETKVEERLIQPVFITEFPRSISPLAKAKSDDPLVAERFELFIASIELANAYSELNDPVEQYEIFKRQAEKRKAGDMEAFMMDEDYIRALEHGMPPASGLGVGIDRVVMLLTDQHALRDVILFPHLRPEIADTTEEKPQENNQ